MLAGNWRDSTTVAEVLADLQARFGLRRVVFVGDRGMVTAGNLDGLRAQGQGYLVGLKRRPRDPALPGRRHGAVVRVSCRLWLVKIKNTCLSGRSHSSKSDLVSSLEPSPLQGGDSELFCLHQFADDLRNNHKRYGASQPEGAAQCI